MSQTPESTRSVPTSLVHLRLATLLACLSTLVQVGLGIAMLSGHGSLTNVHGWFGYLTTALTLVCVWFAYSYRKQTGDSGTFFHSLSLPVLAIAQIGLAEMNLKWVHVVIGVVFVVAMVALFALVDKRVRRV